MELYKKKGLELVSNLIITNKKYPAVIKCEPQKTFIAKVEPTTLPHAMPEKAGISSQVILSMLEALEKEPEANVHSLVIVKDGYIVAECARPGYSPRIAHLSHSMSKTVTGMLIGMLVDDGLLKTSDTLWELFEEYEINEKTAEITVENLLIMSSGIEFSEVGAVTDSRWIETFLSSKPIFEQGKKFAYNSMNSYILMAIAERIISKAYNESVPSFLERRLFSPLGITEFFWEKSPEGIEKGGWGLYLSAESWAKLGLMMLWQGWYQGKQIISSDWVMSATSFQSLTPSETGDYNYGYQMWVSRTTQDFLFNGMLGQNVLVIPRSNLVVAINAGNNELFQDSPTLKIIQSYLCVDPEKIKPNGVSAIIPLKRKTDTFFSERTWVLPKDKRHGIAAFLHLRTKEPFNEAFAPLLSKFRFAENNQGVLPIFVRAMQNNYQGGIDSFEFKKNGQKLILISTEGGTEYVYNVGFYGYEFSVVNYCGEAYLVGAMATSDFSGSWRIEFVFPELPNTRRITLAIDRQNVLTVQMTEIPDSKITDSFVSSIPAMSTKINFALDILESNLGKNFIERRLSELFSPTIVAISESAEDFDALLLSENKKMSETLSSMNIVRMLINKVTGTDEETAEDKTSIGDLIISSIKNNIKNKLFPKDKD